MSDIAPHKIKDYTLRGGRVKNICHGLYYYVLSYALVLYVLGT